jgi:23S rRNA (pseudouridine1915-N3)-methyltransferase
MGKTRESWLKSGVQNYINRIKKYVSVDIKECKGIKYNKKMDLDKILDKEGEKLMKAIPKGSFKIVLDQRGKMLNSKKFASFFTILENQGTRDIALITGGPLGLSKKVVESADFLFSLSKLTFPHDFARLILAEQVYRAFTIKAGEPYHH